MWREATENDVPNIRAMLDDPRFFDVLEDISADAMEAALRAENPSRLLIWTHQRDDLAFAYLTEMDRTHIKLEEFGVFKRGSGYGATCLRQLIERLRTEQHYAHLVLHVTVENVRAMRLYERLGFQRVEKKVNGWTTRRGRPIDIWRYTLDL